MLVAFRQKGRPLSGGAESSWLLQELEVEEELDLCVRLVKTQSKGQRVGSPFVSAEVAVPLLHSFSLTSLLEEISR